MCALTHQHSAHGNFIPNTQKTRNNFLWTKLCPPLPPFPNQYVEALDPKLLYLKTFEEVIKVKRSYKRPSLICLFI